MHLLLLKNPLPISILAHLIDNCLLFALLAGIDMKKQDNQKLHGRGVVPGHELWMDGLICAFELIRGPRKFERVPSPFEHKIHSYPKFNNIHEIPLPLGETAVRLTDSNVLDDHSSKKKHPSSHCVCGKLDFHRSYWIPIGWARISELVQTVRVDEGWALLPYELSDADDDVAVADVAAPYRERRAGPTWWCHVDAAHPKIGSWLSNAQWLHPAISTALRDERRLISERMKHLLYEVPVRVAGGLLFELLGQSAGDPFVDEDDIPIVLRSWQAQRFLVTTLHVKGTASNINVLGITEVQELLAAGDANVPQNINEVIALLASHLARWDDRLFRKYIFGAADEVELMFMNRRTHEDLRMFSIILSQEIRRLSTQVIRVKWSLHAREEIIFELLQHLRGATTRSLLEGIRKSFREMIEEQEAVRGCLFTIQDVMQSKFVHGCRSLTVTHNLGIFGGCGLVLSIITGLFGINVDGIPGADGSPYAFAMFSGILFLLGLVLIGVGLLYLGLKEPVTEQHVEVRKLELQELVRMFQHEAESHAQVRKTVPRSNLPPTAADKFPNASGCVSNG